jgi:apolipoprotein N-acyltransferase
VAGHMLTDVPVRTGLTPAVVAGEGIKIAIGWGSLIALVALGLTVLVRTRRRSRPGKAKMPAPAGPASSG